MSNSSSSSGGVGFGGLLFLVFLVLKLTGVIAWSWWWVTAPLWAPLVLALVMLLISVLFITTASDRKKQKRRTLR